MELNSIIEKASYGGIIAVIGNTTSLSQRDNIESGLVHTHLLNVASKEKVLKALQIVSLPEEILNKRIESLSVAIKNKLLIVKALISKNDTFVFYDIHKGLNYREAEDLKRLLKKLASLNKKIILFTNDVEFLFNLTKNILLINGDEEIVEHNPVDWFDENLYQYVSKPPIIEFIIHCRNRNIKIENALETKELLKAIYRGVSK